MNKRYQNIEWKLELLYNSMEYPDYVKMIKSDPILHQYDRILGCIDINIFPFFSKMLLTKKKLVYIESYLDKYINNLSIICF